MSPVDPGGPSADGAFASGSVCFVGAGPGAGDLITVRGAQRLAAAEVVLADALTDPALRVRAPQARWIDVGKRGFCDATGQARINALLVQHALAGQRVLRLKGGDPSVFGRLEEELQALAEAGIACEVVPGISAALAAAADSLRPLTRRGRGRSVAFTTAMTRDGRLQAGRHADTEVFYMAGRQLAALGRALQAAGWPATTPVHVVSRAGCVDSLGSQHALAGLAQAALLHAGRPTVVTVGAGAQPVSRAPAVEGFSGISELLEAREGHAAAAAAPVVAAVGMPDRAVDGIWATSVVNAPQPDSALGAAP